MREALSLGHNYVGTEHLLLGLVRENEGVAARVLLDFDADAEKIRNEIIRALSGQPRSGLAGSIQVRGGFGSPAGGRTSLRLGRLEWQSMVVGAALLGLGILIGWAIWG